MSICPIEPRLDRDAVLSALGLAPGNPHYAVFSACYARFEPVAKTDMARLAVWREAPASVFTGPTGYRPIRYPSVGRRGNLRFGLER